MAEQTVKYEIVRHYGVLSKTKGWQVEFNLVNWGGREDRYDLRRWSIDHKTIGKGITLSENELRILSDLINKEIEYLDNL